jgi:peroxiredoxin
MELQAPPGGPSNRPGLLILGLGLVVGLLAGLAVFVGPGLLPSAASAGPQGTPATPAPAPVVGAPAPDFTLQDIEGNAVQLSALAGQVVVVNFWATWCGPCKLEMPALQARYDALKDQGLTVLAVNLDEPLEQVQAFAQDLNLTFPILLDPGAKVNELYRVRGYPTTFFVNREGMIDRQHVGIMSDSQLADYLGKLGLLN